ncbi:hypothetical protein K474DRAFT_1585528 [Panus rudis PR-1116 ss-1]|nr:hypothetical protein K474DRAFT_1585528 [Panus rudis PR-1116 ss-1]
MQRSVSLRATPRVINATTTGLSGALPHKPNNLTNAGNRSTKPQLDTLQIGPSRRKADVASAVSSSFPQTSTRTPHFAERDPASPVSSTSGHSSSWGRSAGKHALRSAHGAFRFEPAVPTIPGSPAHDERQSAARGTPGSPTRLKPDRVGAKGRSLDLGIGLTWAPSTVKEEAVLAYGAGRPGGGISASTSRARARWRGGWVDEDGRLGASDPGGSDVAEAFKEALGEAAYVTFKNYVHRFDADAIPLDGPYGLISHVKRLLDEANSLGEREKRALIDRFVRFVHENR